MSLNLKEFDIRQITTGISLLIVLAILFYGISYYNYLLFHIITEGFAIVVALLIYFLAVRSYAHSKNEMFLFLGIAYLHIAGLDFFHTVTYKGMSIFANYSADTPTQLWIAGRFMEAISLVVALFPKRERINRVFLSGIYSIVTLLTLLSIMVFRNFPPCFVEGEGLTRFKIQSEYIIIAVLLLGVFLIHGDERGFNRANVKTVQISMMLTALSEFFFTLYSDVYGIANMMGHLVKVFSYYVIFEAVLSKGISEPFRLMSEELRFRAERDMLTGLYNRQGLMELLDRELYDTSRYTKGLGILMIDLDRFKSVNDNYGHLAGDLALKDFAALLEDCIREEDDACRFGGDEFIVLVRDVDLSGVQSVKKRIQAAFSEWVEKDERFCELGVSIGASILKKGATADLDGLIKTADDNMYEVKIRKRASRMYGARQSPDSG